MKLLRTTLVFCALVLAAMLLMIGHALAEVILSCNSQWSIADCKVEANGSISSGCSDPGPILIELGKANYVRTVASQFWVPTANVKPDDLVYVAPGKSSGDKVDAAVCAKDFLIQTKVSDLGGTQPVPPPIVTPAPPPTASLKILSWGIPTCDCNPTGYHLRWTGPVSGEASVGLVNSYTITNLTPGAYSSTIATVNADGESEQSPPYAFTIDAPTVPPVTSPPVVPPPTVIYRVKAIAAGTRPATELVLSADGTAKVLGYKLGDVPVGKPCDLVKQLGTSSSEYHLVNEADVVLLSPTYKGRQLVSVCGK